LLPLDRNTHSLSLQFSFSNPSVIPESIRSRTYENQMERVERKSRATGNLEIQPTVNCSLKKITIQIEEAGYILQDAKYIKRIHGSRKGVFYHMVRFYFVRKEYSHDNPEFSQVRDEILNDLRRICENDFWRVRVFDNPYYVDGEAIEGMRYFSVNLEARIPRFNKDGSLALVWARDQYKNKIGYAPQPIKAKFILQIKKNKIFLCPLNEI